MAQGKAPARQPQQTWLSQREVRCQLALGAARQAGGTLTLDALGYAFPRWPGCWVVTAARDLERAGLATLRLGRLELTGQERRAA